MKNCLEVFLVMLIFQSALSYSIQQQYKSVSEFCWKDTYNRGIGIFPDQCKSDRDKIGSLCYSKCPTGFTRVYTNCHQICPVGMINQGPFCRLQSYNRVGYKRSPGDGLKDKGMIERCQKNHGKGNCEKNGDSFYPKCKNGYYASGCCTCQPIIANCNALGLNNGFGPTCAKKIIIGNHIPIQCGVGYQKNLGLCYKPCNNNFEGIGPLCWGSNPSGWVGCGMGSAKDLIVCASKSFNMVLSAGNLAFNILKSVKPTNVITVAAKPSYIKKKFQQLKKIYKQSQDFRKLVSAALAGKSLGELMAAKTEQISLEDILRVSAQIAALVDPTGTNKFVAAVTYPRCSKIVT